VRQPSVRLLHKAVSEGPERVWRERHFRSRHSVTGQTVFSNRVPPALPGPRSRTVSVGEGRERVKIAPGHRFVAAARELDVLTRHVLPSITPAIARPGQYRRAQESQSVDADPNAPGAVPWKGSS
jgi:hypothetical protein